MNAREHYEKAERFIDLAETLSMDAETNDQSVEIDGLIAAAQVHATLALAAAHGADQPTLDELMPVPED